MTDNQAQLTYTVAPGMDFNDTTIFADESSAWAYSDKICNHVDTSVSHMRKIFQNKHITITDPPYLAEPHTPFTESDETSELEKSLAIKNTQAIYKAICDVSKLGGGTVIIPSCNNQVFYTSALRVESNVNIYLEEGAILKFTTDFSLYYGKFMNSLYPDTTDEQGLTLTRFESVELMNYSPFIYAYGKKNVAISGQGTLDGSASLHKWHDWKYESKQEPSRTKLFSQGQRDIPVKSRQYGENSFLRPNFIQFYNCQNILIEKVTLTNSPMWEINPVLCDTVLIQNVTVNCHLSNNDGCDPESSSNVVIRGNKFDVGDDCIAIKSGRNGDGLRVRRATFNVVIEKNRFADGHGGVTIGSEVTNGVKNVFSNFNEMDSCNLQSAYRFKTNYIRGGRIENIYYKSDVVRMIQINRAVVTVDLNYNIVNEVKMMKFENLSFIPFIPSFRRVFIKGLTVNPDCAPNSGGFCAIQLSGFDKGEIDNSCDKSGVSDCFVSEFTIEDSLFVGCRRAFMLRNVERLTLNRVVIKGTEEADIVKNCRNLVFTNCDFRDSAIKRENLTDAARIENTTFQ